VWSLANEQSAAAPKPSKPDVKNLRVPEPAAAESTQASTKKGWWQRTFRSDS
jgi:hypothetical protein